MTTMPLLDPRTATVRRADTLASHGRAVERVIDAMRQRLDEAFSLREMAKVAFMSPFHFNRTFRRLTGVPPVQYLSAVRLETAKRLLLTTDMSVTDVCLEVGYQSLGSFIRRFTALVGLSPRRLRTSAGSGANVGRAGGDGSSIPAVSSTTAVRGRVTAPPGFEGPVFLGLFPTPVPQGRPVACTVLARTGEYGLVGVPDGLYYLMAVGLPRPAEARQFSLFESALRGGGQALAVSGGAVTGMTHVMLRERDPLDPPILMALPRESDRPSSPPAPPGAPFAQPPRSREIRRSGSSMLDGPA